MRIASVFIAAAMLSSPLAAAQGQALAGVADKETSIPSGGVREYHRGKGDVLYVRHVSDRWFRVQLNEGCLKPLTRSDSLAFHSDLPGGRIDRFTQVVQPTLGIACSITSIRRSVAPPQVDSKSPITLD